MKSVVLLFEVPGISVESGPKKYDQPHVPFRSLVLKGTTSQMYFLGLWS